MEDRAFNLKTGEISVIETSSRIDQSPLTEITPHPPLVSLPFAEARMLHRRNQRRRKRLLTFIALELSAVLLFVLLLVAGTSAQFAQARFTRPFELAIILMSAVVVLIPVIFYGLPRQRYRYHRHN